MGNLGQNPTPLAPPTACNRTCQNPTGLNALHQSGRGSRRSSQSQLVHVLETETKVRDLVGNFKTIHRQVPLFTSVNPPPSLHTRRHTQEECVSW